MRLSTSSEWLWSFIVVRRNLEQLGDISVQSTGQPIEDVDRGIVRTRLNPADRATVDISVDGKELLAETIFGSQPPQVPANACARLHRPQAINWKPLNLSDISDINASGAILLGKRRMKISAGVLGLVIGIMVLLQSCTVATTAGLISEDAVSSAGALGMFVALMFLLAGGFAFGLPLAGACVFVVAGLLGFLASADFPDMMIWGFVAFGLAALSFFGWRSGRSRMQRSKAP